MGQALVRLKWRKVKCIMQEEEKTHGVQGLITEDIVDEHKDDLTLALGEITGQKILEIQKGQGPTILKNIRRKK